MDFVFFTLLLRDSFGNSFLYLVTLLFALFEPCLKEDRIHLDMTGPKSTGVTLRLVDSNNQIFNQQNIDCRGERFEAEIDLPLIQSDWGQFYLTAVYFLTDGTEVPSVWQWRINLSSKTKIPLDWLLIGVGVSSETLLQTIIVE